MIDMNVFSYHNKVVRLMQPGPNIVYVCRLKPL
jgi:hypothetical protein